MSTPIEDYAIIGDTRTVAAVAATARSTGGASRASIPVRSSLRCSASPKHGRWLDRPERDRHRDPPSRTPATHWSSRPSSRRATAR